MPSLLERAIQDNRSRLKARDDRALSILFDAVELSRDRLQPRIALVEEAIAGMDTPDPSDVFTLTRWLEMERQMTGELQSIADQLGPRLQAEQRAVLLESATQTQHLALVSGGSDAQVSRIATGWAHVPVDAMTDLIAALDANAPVGKLLSTFGEDAAQRARNALIEASSRGVHPRAVANTLMETLDISRNRAMTISRTELLRADRSAKLRNYRENASILSGWTWLCGKNTRTCLQCLALDGRTYSLNVDFFPGHPACRCTPIPRLIGATHTLQTGQQWFDAQPEATQREMLPQGAHDAYFNGSLQLMDFVHQDDSPIWGRSFRQGSIAQALAKAGARA